MNIKEITFKYNRRLEEILQRYEEALQVVKAARVTRDQACTELDSWFDREFDGLKKKEAQ